MNLFLRHARLALAMGALLLASCAPATPPPAGPTPTLGTPVAPTLPPTQITNVELLGMITVPHNFAAFETPVGGLSAIAYDSATDHYYFLSDDRAMFGPTRIYQATINVSDGTLVEGDLIWTAMIPLRDEAGASFGPRTLDPEALVLADDRFYVASEGDAASQPPVAPAIIEFTRAGEFVASLPLPDKFVPTADGTRGVRNNKGFESLTRTPDGRYLLSGMENALVQDGPAATLEDTSPARILTFDLDANAVISEKLYSVEAIPVAPTPATGDADNGLVDMLALDNQGTMLAMERSYAVGAGNTIRLYLANVAGATEIGDLEALADVESGGVIIDAPIVKELLVDFGELGRSQGITPDNLEGLAWGPQLPDGRHVLLVVSDNNFNDGQTTQIWALALTVE